MSNTSGRDGDTYFDLEEFLQIGTRCRELRLEKELLKSSQSQSFELIRILELREKSLSEACAEDKKHIQGLEKELLNCSQEIDCLRDQLNAWKKEVKYLEERVHSLELKLEEMEYLQEEVHSLRAELQRSNSEEFFLRQELETQEMELQKSAESIGKLERLISSMALESPCVIESMKLDMMALEQSILESRKIQKDSVEEKSKMTRLIEELQVAYQDAQNVIISLNEENRELKKKLNAADMLAKELSQKVEEWLENRGISKIYGQTSLTEQDCNPSISKDRRYLT